MAVNENRKGYKKTKLGWIPEVWDEFNLNEIAEKWKLGGNYENSESNKGIPLIKMGNIGRGVINLNKLEKLKVDEEINPDDILKEGDLLFNTRNTLELVGKVSIWRNELPKAAYNSNLMRITFRNDKVHSTYFMNYLFNSLYALAQLRSFAIGTTSVAAIYTRDLLNFKVALPSLPEQQKIAKILTTWDKAIELTQELIQAKTRRKKGLMQQLLTGKKRFEEFVDRKGYKNTKIGKIPKKWGLQHLEKCAEVLFSNVDKKMDKKENPVLLCNYTDVYYNDYISENLDFMKATAKAAEIRKYSLKKGDVIITKDSETPDDIAVPAFVSEKLDNVLCGYHLALIRPDRKILLGEYLSKLLQLQTYRYYFFTLANGVTRFGLTTQATLQSLIPLPSITEQRKIAAVLTTCDKEIDLLNQKLEALKQQKKGLMQKLLTGQIRVNQICLPGHKGGDR